MAPRSQARQQLGLLGGERLFAEDAPGLEIAETLQSREYLVIGAAGARHGRGGTVPAAIANTFTPTRAS